LKKLTQRQKNFFIIRSRRTIKTLQKRNRKIRIVNKYNYAHKNHKIIVDVPERFSIIDYPDETLAFFNKVYKDIKTLKLKSELFFNLANITFVSVDAVMYLIALIKNTKLLKTMSINCSGNVPQNMEARRIIETCGFYNYVSPQYTVNKINNSNINIASGTNADAKLAGEICDFVHNNSLMNRNDTKSVYTLIIELMTNTRQHAYNNIKGVKNKWYIYVESNEEKIRFVFLDTGEGIPNTIRINFYEKLLTLIDNSDSHFIASALRGKFRTETLQEHRGKGLPEIYNKAVEESISGFSIVSCKGKCDIKKDGSIDEIKLNSGLRGTLFYWELLKH